jgi:hypothetical protein
MMLFAQPSIAGKRSVIGGGFILPAKLQVIGFVSDFLGKKNLKVTGCSVMDLSLLPSPPMMISGRLP